MGKDQAAHSYRSKIRSLTSGLNTYEYVYSVSGDLSRQEHPLRRRCH